MTAPQHFTPAIKAACDKRCASFGEPSCYEIPNVEEICEHVTPCADCIADATELKGGDV